MDQYYRIVLELYKEAIQGKVRNEAIDASQLLLAKAITTAHVKGESDMELQQLKRDIADLKQYLS